MAPLDPAAIAALAAQVAASGAETCALCLLNAFVNSAHEIAVTEALRARLPGVVVSPSHEVSPEMREFERTATRVLNALLVPVMALDREGALAALAAKVPGPLGLDPDRAAAGC